MATMPGDSLHEQVYQKIKSDILLGLYPPGEKLDVNGLAIQYNVSRTPVRDALHVLQREDLVEILPRVGYFTSRITIKDIEDVFQLRLIVETASAELAAVRISEEDLAYLERLSGRYVAGDVQSYREFRAENREFHHRGALASGNRRLAQVVDGLLNQMQRMLVLRLDLRDNADEMLAEHGRLLSALRACDSVAARELMADALRNAQEAVMQSILTKGKDWPL